MPPSPPSNAHGFAMSSMSLIRDMQSPKSEKKFLAPPPPKSWGRPWSCIFLSTHRIMAPPLSVIKIVKYCGVCVGGGALGGGAPKSPKNNGAPLSVIKIVIIIVASGEGGIEGRHNPTIDNCAPSLCH